MFNHILNTFYQGAQAAMGSSSKGLIQPEGAPPVVMVPLWDYYNQGFNCALAARNKSEQKTEPSKPSSMKLPDPEAFAGKRDKLESFITELHVKFNMEKERFPNDVRKIAYASSFLTKDAKVWFNPYVDKDTGEISFDTWTEFITELRRCFGDPNKAATAAAEIEKLEHTNSIDYYYSKFKEYMDILGWSEDQKIYRFRKGLRSHIKDLLVSRGQYTEKTTFEALYIHARNAENDLLIRSQEGKSSNPSQPKPHSGNRSNHANERRAYYQPSQPARRPGHNSTAYGTHSGPMDLNAAPKRTSKPKVYTKLTKEEKDSRFKKGQCFYCKAEGHYASACPLSKAKAERQGNWKKPEPRKAFVANKEGTSEVEKGKVVYSLGGEKPEESKN